MYPETALVLDTFTGNLGSPSNGGGNLAFYFMNEWFLFYLGMALAGGILSWFHVFLPVRSMFKKEGNLKHPYVNSPVWSTLVWVILAAIMLPFICSSLLFENKREIFIKATYDGAK